MRVITIKINIENIRRNKMIEGEADRVLYKMIEKFKKKIDVL